MMIFRNSRVVSTLSKRKAGLIASCRIFCLDFATEIRFQQLMISLDSYQEMCCVDELKSICACPSRSKDKLSVSSTATISLPQKNNRQRQPDSDLQKSVTVFTCGLYVDIKNSDVQWVKVAMAEPLIMQSSSISIHAPAHCAPVGHVLGVMLAVFLEMDWR